MRICEVVLIVGTILWLLIFSSKQPKVILLWAAAANSSVLIFHGIFEGLRYQMVLTYIIVVFLAAITSVKAARGLKDRRSPKRVIIPAIILAFIFLGLSAFLATALPVFSLPTPTGKFAVGIQYFHLVDESRLDPFLEGTTRQRELMVKIYYPADDDPTKPYMRYFHNSPKMIRAFAAFYHLPDFMFDHFRLVKTGTKEGLPLASHQDSYPVILFSHGAGTSMEVQTSQSADLASYGYIVLAVDHTYVSSATEFPDRVVYHWEATTDFQTAEPAEIITEIMADDIRFVMNTLEEMNQGDPIFSFKHSLKLDRIGVIGHSVGGATAYNLALSDPRIKAAINLDGVVYRTPRAGEAVIAPFLMLVSDGEHLQAIRDGESLMRPLSELPDVDRSIMLSMYGSEAAYQEAFDKAQQNVVGLTSVLRESGNLYSIKGCDHMKFTDIGLYFGLRPIRELLGIRGDLDPARCLVVTEDLTHAFFDLHLKGGDRDELKNSLEKYPEMQKIYLN